MNPQITLLHLELFHHWDKETRPTLIYPQIWPIILQRAFNVQSPSTHVYTHNTLSNWK